VRVFVLGSASSGNALLVEACGTRVLIEAGVSPRLVARRLAELGVELEPVADADEAGAESQGPPEDAAPPSSLELSGILASHRHGDHYGHADALATAFGAPLYLHRGIPRPARPEPEVRRYEVGATVQIGALTVTTVQVPHDAAQVAFRIDDGATALGIATDVGRVTPALVALLAECDAALVEANHCTELLAFSEYPDVVKRRVAGGFGHLSNAQAAELASRLVGTRLARIWLGHLSRSNNTPARALEVVSARARRMDVRVLPADVPVALDVRASRPCQLGLPF
jgi:phosphoribosyl 1,2-cyclic phosphodiesterase